MPHRAVLALVIAVAAGVFPGSGASKMTAASRPRDLTGGTAAPAAGVPLALAVERAARVHDVRYSLHMTVPAALDDPVRGTVTVRFRLTDATRPLSLDFAGPLSSVRLVGGAEGASPITLANEHIVIAPEALREGENAVSLAFEASDLPLNRQPEFMYTLFVPARARMAFPCFDQPDLKARYTLTLDVPRGWEAISNGTVVTREATPDGSRILFAETAPISSYLFAFSAGLFKVERSERSGRAFTMLHRETDAEKLARNRDAIFDLHVSALDWLEEYTGIPYAFGKFEFVLIPSFQFGGMEHPGAIFYNASTLLLDASATQNQQLGRASLIAHETAHMWFGDLVTMRWFDDVWMKEVFANFMAAKIVNPSFPGIDHELRFLYAHYPAAYDVDRTAGTNPIRQPLANLNEAGSLYGAIIYQKAPIVMRQLELSVTPGGLRDGLRDYLRRYAFANASWTDLIRLLDARTGDDLAAWSREWVEEAGRPVVTTEDVRVTADEELTVVFTQRDPDAGRALTWPQRMLVAAEAGGTQVTRSARLDGPQTTVTLPVPPGRQRPQYVLPTGGGLAYGDFVLDQESRAYLTRFLHHVQDPLTRGAALVTLWEEMLAGRVPPGTLFTLLVTAVGEERDELTVQRMLTYTQQVFWRFLPADDRILRARQLEPVLRAGLASAPSSSLKSAWFNALRDTALTPATLGWIEEVWHGIETVPGLTLAEPDYISLALELAVREVPGWYRILTAQRERIENPDRRAQFEFVMPALSGDPARRAAFFNRLRDVEHRRREAWVLQALGYLHHPLRASSAGDYIDASLAMLLDIQRTGDIFFPKRWMDATLSGHQSPEAAGRVRRFLGQLPAGYPPRLRQIILSSADDLFRASALAGGG